MLSHIKEECQKSLTQGKINNQQNSNEEPMLRKSTL